MKKKILFVFTAILFVALLVVSTTHFASATELSDNINEQLSNLDLSELQNYFDNLNNGGFSSNFISYFYGLLNGEYDFDYKTLGEYVINCFLGQVYQFIPAMISIISIAIFCSILHSFKGKFISDGVSDLISFVCLISVVLILSSQIIFIWQNVQITLENMAKLVEIMSPIILTLMVASGASVSASVYKPAVSFLCSGIINVVLYIVMPLITVMTVFAVISSISKTTKLNKFSDFLNGSIKWILGLACTVFGLFLSIQGVTSATFDGVSIKAAKYAISNSVPLIGGFLRDGFDLVVAGSVIIKNAVGITSVIALFFLLLSPVLYMASFSLMLKLVSALIQPICDVSLSDFCMAISKGITYLCVTVLIVAFMFFIMVLLMIFSANAFI